MSDVFISYAREAEAAARRIAEALRGLGYGVWRDDELPAHRDYSEVIEERLRAAKAVVVVWSADAVRSQWVRAEADLAREAGTLVQLTLDGAPLPMPFNRVQCADLAGWEGDLASSGWRKVVASVAELAGAKKATSSPDYAATPKAAAEPLLAVLAFDNLSGDPDMAYFSDGVSEEILDTVARGSGLRVIAPSSSFRFRGADKAVRRVTADLKATHLLDGSVRRAGSRVRVSAHLVECASETAIWSDRFDRELVDVFALQDEIAGAVAEALKVALRPTPKPALIKPEAYEAYLRAQPMVHQDLYHASEDAVPLLERVVADTPGFAAAWENLAVARAKLLRSGHAAQAYPEARAGVVEAAENALKLDPSRGRAHLALALLEPWAAYVQQETLIDRALAASENDALLIMWRAMQLSIVGRAQAALDEGQRAVTLDPLVPFGGPVLAAPLGQLGRYSDALRHWDKRLSDPRVPQDFVGPLINAALMGDWERLDRYDALVPPGHPITTLGARGDAQLRRFLSALRTNDRETMNRSLARARAILSETGTLPLNALTQLTIYGLREEAYELAEAASFDHMFRPDGPLPTTAFGPNIIFERYRDGGLPADPRFLRLCAKLGLVSYWLVTDAWPDCADQVAYDFRAEARKIAAEGLARGA